MRSRLLIAIIFSGACTTGLCAEPACHPTNVPEAERGAPDAPTIEVYGKISGVTGTRFTLTTRDGKTIKVDAARAENDERAVDLQDGLLVVVAASRGAQGELIAHAVGRAKPSPIAWARDCLGPAS